MVNDKAAGTPAEPARPPPPRPKVVGAIAQPAPVLPQATVPGQQPAPSPQQDAGPGLPLPPPPPPPPPPPVQVTGPPAPVLPLPTEVPAEPASKAEVAPPPEDGPPVAEKKVREYRYRTRIIKAALLPTLFSVMSFWMLYVYVNSYEPYFSYDFDIILSGFAVGAVVTTGFLIANMRVARRDGSYATRQRNSLVIILAFLVPYLYLLILVNISLAWKFSVGYFFSALLTPVVVMAYEAYARGKYFVLEEELDDRLTRTLVFRA